MSEKILIIVHQEQSTPGRVGRLLRERGFQLDIRRPRYGDPLPRRMDDHFGAIIFGGPMSANDKEAYVTREIDWIDVPLRDERPFLGICLGAQMMARHLGGRVYEHPDGYVEIGYYPLEATQDGRALCDWPDHVYHWHRETFDLPCGATHLARSPKFECQAFQYGKNAFAVQFHAELTLAMLHRWTVHGALRLGMKGAQGRADHFRGRAIYDASVRKWLDGFLDIWVARGRAA